MDARRFLLTADNTLRVVTLSPGGWRLYGAGTQVFYGTRPATAAAGTLADGYSAPTVGQLNAAAAGSPTVGIAYGVQSLPDGVDANSSVRGGAALPTDTASYVEISVPSRSFLNLYVCTASGTATPALVGPYL
jgi:hypothetical protein